MGGESLHSTSNEPVKRSGDGNVASVSAGDDIKREADAIDGSPESDDDQKNSTQLQYVNGVTSLSWDRRSRTLLAGAIGDRNLRLMDNTHPQASLDCAQAVRRQWLSGQGADAAGGERECGGEYDDDLLTPRGKNRRDGFADVSPSVMTSLVSPSPGNEGEQQDLSTTPASQHRRQLLEKGSPKESFYDESGSGERIHVRLETVSFGRARLLRGGVLSLDRRPSSSPSLNESSFPSSSYSKHADASPTQQLAPSTMTSYSSLTGNDSSNSRTTMEIQRSYALPDAITVPTMRHTTLVLELPQSLGGPAQLHPRDNHAGLACMIDGSLALFWIPPVAFYEALPSLVADDQGGVSSAKGGRKRSKDNNIEKGNNEKFRLVRRLLEEEEANRVGNVGGCIGFLSLSLAFHVAYCYALQCCDWFKSGAPKVR